MSMWWTKMCYNCRETLHFCFTRSQNSQLPSNVYSVSILLEARDLYFLSRRRACLMMQLWSWQFSLEKKKKKKTHTYRKEIASRINKTQIKPNKKSASIDGEYIFMQTKKSIFGLESEKIAHCVGVSVVNKHSIWLLTFDFCYCWGAHFILFLLSVFFFA